MAKTQEQKLSDKQVELIAKAVIEHLEKEQVKRDKEKHDRRLRNVKLLLKHYRSFVKHADQAAAELTASSENEILKDLFRNELTVESVKLSGQRSIVMVRFMKRMLDIYRIACNESKNPEDKRRYEVIHSMYLSEKKMTVEELAKCHNVDRSTIFRDTKKAYETLSVLMFGIDGVKFE